MNPYQRSDRWFLVSLSFVVLAIGTVTRADPDLWGHVRFGLDTLREHRLTSIDPYSFTQDVPWLNHEWLSEVQMALAWRIAGPAGLALLKGFLLTGTACLMWPTVRGTRLGDRAGVLILVILGTIHMWAVMRPQLWTLLLFVILCRILVSAGRVRWVLPPLFAVWANCHGGWVVGLGVLGVWTAAAVVLRREDWRDWVVVLMVSLGATLLNPYGLTLWVFLWQTVPVARSIQEWQPLWTAPALNWLPWCAGVAGLVWSAVRRPRESGRLRSLAVLVMLACSAVRVQRLESLFVVASTMFLGPELAKVRPLIRRVSATGAIARVVAPASLLGAIAITAVILMHTLGCIQVFGDWVPDTATAQLLAGAPAGRLVTFFDWGEYAIWQFGPRLKVSIDGRRETIYSEHRLVESDAIVAGTSAGLDVLSAWRAEYIWLPARSIATKRWLLANGYRVDRESARSFVAVRADLPHLVPPLLARPTPCFPE